MWAGGPVQAVLWHPAAREEGYLPWVSFSRGQEVAVYPRWVAAVLGVPFEPSHAALDVSLMGALRGWMSVPGGPGLPSESQALQLVHSHGASWPLA